MKTDIQIAQENQMLHIDAIAQALGIDERYIEHYGRHKAKVDHRMLSTLSDRPDGRLVLVTAINPTPAGEGKTTTSIGLADGLRRIGKRAVLALREPSLGPAFGVKGGAAGGGYAQVVPMEEINLHFTGDFHAVGAANNLLAAMLDNHIFQGNALGIDPRRITWHRCVDMNDRQLRHLTDGLGGHLNGVPREDHYDITVASEIMAVMCLAEDIEDLKARLARMVVGYTYDRAPVTAGDLKAQGAMAALLRDALNPNLVQTLEHTPAFVHCGPFANIAHGCNSVIATRMALKLGEYVVTEAGFGADLGAQKFMDIKCRTAGMCPDAVVVVATTRALKCHGGAKKGEYASPDEQALSAGLANLWRHVDNMQSVYGISTVVAINRFADDDPKELELIRSSCAQRGIPVALCEGWAKGGAGMAGLAEAVIAACEAPSRMRLTYSDELPLKEKISAIATKVYRASGVSYTAEASNALKRFERLGYGGLPICMAKTQYSFSDNPKKLNAPEDFRITVREARLSAGAGFIVALTGEIMTMPGLPKVPAAEGIDVDSSGVITGLF